MPFATLGLSPALVRAASALGYAAPTPIQLQAIPAILKSGDVLGLAQTGSGKTAAFCLPLLQNLQGQRDQNPSQSGRTVTATATAAVPQRRKSIHTLILVPTRELAAQVGEVIGNLAQHLPVAVKTAVVFGGVSINPQMMGLRGGADVLVATPGRLLDLIDHNALGPHGLANVNTLVLDEADRLLDLGFADELSRILALLPAKRQSLFFSATFPQAVQALADALLHQPVRIEIEATPATQPVILQRAIEVDAPKRTQLLRHLVQQNDWTRVLVFVATKHAAEIVADKLRKAGVDAEPFHGLLSQGKRSQVLADFKASRVRVVVATDLAARGIDIAELPVVVNYDLPRSSVDYVHRIGRTGRAGESGVAISFVTADSDAHFRLIEKRQALNLLRETIAGFEPVEAIMPALAMDATDATAPGTGGIKGKRPSKKDKLRAAAST
jgi:ATP-dependent RNA helicase RhlE